MMLFEFALASITAMSCLSASAVIKAESTTLIGATLASESNNLELRTNSLTAQNLDDYSKSNTSGFSVGAGSGNASTVTVGANRSGHEMQGQTLATIGAGRILRLDDGSDLSPALTASLNRDLTKAQIITKKQDTGGLNVTLTLDTRVLTADGRAAVKKDFVDSKEHAKEIVQAGKDVVNTELGVQDFAGRVNDLAQDRQVLAKTASNTDAVDKLRGDQAAKGSQEGAQTLSDKLAQAGEQKGSAQVLLYQGNQVATDDTRVNSTNDFNKNISNSGYNAKSDQTVINTAQVNMTDATQVVQAVAHENARRDMSTGGTGSNLGATDQTTLASTRGQRAADTFAAYADLNNQSTQSSSTQAQWNADNANSATIQTGNAVVAKMDSKEVKPWLGDAQKAQAQKELSAAKGVDKLVVLGKWSATSVKQDGLTTIGVGKGLIEGGVNDIKGVAEFLKDPVKGLDGLAQLVNSPEAREKVGAEMLNSLNTRIASMKSALKEGGDQNAEQLGKDLGNLIYQTASVVTVVNGVAKGGAALARVGIEAGATTLESTALVLSKMDAGAVKSFKSAEEVNATMVNANKFLPPGQGWTPAWKPGTQVADVTMQPGTKVQMVVDKAAYDALTAPPGTVDISKSLGGWATLDNVTSQAQARNSLAITRDMKANVGYVIELEVTKPINAKVGVVGEQGAAAGGGNQVQFVVPQGDRSSIFKVVGGKKLP